ncbi:phage portal protein [Enterococcus cecorum]|uniref:phage tail assembly chaperone n=1 Tax=Enterococcus cecorum TaxID=44008 RepID=UPI001FAB862C|nr:phage portal protein [Enterococcus cecorum]MCJ0586717.1 phage portal protein [Enterococcus cecorum]MCJ0591219.1 phage portal protein [Enterococcus cecorum]
MAEIIDIKSFLVKPEAERREIKFERFDAPFIIESITERENARLRKMSTISKRNRQGQTEKSLNTDLYVANLMARSVVQPDLNNAELQTFFGTEGSASDTLNAMLLPGEFANLQEAVLELNHFDDELEVREQVKK